MKRKQQERIKQAEKALAALSGLTAPHPLRESSARRRMLKHAARLRASARPAPRRRLVLLLRLGLAACLTLFATAALTGIAAAAMVDLWREGEVSDRDLEKALKKYDIDGGKPNPRLV